MAVVVVVVVDDSCYDTAIMTSITITDPRSVNGYGRGAAAAV